MKLDDILDNELIDMDELIVAFSHSQVLNEIKELKYKELQLLWRELGKSIFKLYISTWLYKNYSTNTQKISFATLANEQDLLMKIRNNPEFTKHFLFTSKLNNKSQDGIIYQVIGYLVEKKLISDVFDYLDSYMNIQKIKQYHITSSEIILMFIFERGKNEQLIYKELETDINSPEFHYSLTVNGKTAIGTGPSKKVARINASKNYLEKFVNKSMIDLFLNSFETTTNQTKKKIPNIFLLEVSKVKKQNGITNPNFISTYVTSAEANTYNIISNEVYAYLGTNVYNSYIYLNIIKYYRDKSLNIEENEIGSLVTFLTKVEHKDVDTKFSSIFLRFHLDKIRLLNNVENTAIAKQNNQKIKALFYFIFYEQGFNGIDNLYGENIKDQIQNFDITNQNLSQLFNSIAYKYQLTFDVITRNLDNSLFESSLIIELNNQKFSFRGTGDSIVKSKENSFAQLRFFLQLEQRLHISDNLSSDKEKLVLAFLERNLINLLKNRKIIHKNNKIIDMKLFSFLESIKKLNKETIFNLTVNCLKVFSKEEISFIDKTEIVFSTALNFYLESRLEVVNPQLFLSDKKFELLNKNYLDSLIQTNPLVIKNVPVPSIQTQLLAVKEDIESFYMIKNPHENVMEYVDKHTKKREARVENLIDEFIISDDYSKSVRLDPMGYFDGIVNSLLNFDKLKEVKIATGYVFNSGLNLIDFENINCPISLCAGNLQNYYSSKNINMDKQTGISLSQMLSRDNFQLFTVENCFFHGKLWLFSFETWEAAIIGSTNMSYPAFRTNRETSILFLNKSQNTIFKEEILAIFDQATDIDYLDTNLLESKEPNESLIATSTITQEQIKKEINLLNDNETQARLLNWLLYNPDLILDGILIGNSNYFAMEFKNKKMVVLESLYHGNSYFVFYGNTMMEVQDLIQNKTKTEIFKISNMDKRGYHIREQLKIEAKIRSYFLT